MKFKHESGLSLIYKNKDVIFILRKITFEKFSLYTERKSERMHVPCFTSKLKKNKKQHFTSSLLHVFEMSKKKRKEKCFIILNSLWEKNESK